MGKLYIVGIGNYNYEDLTIKADNALKNSDLIYCDEKSYQMLISHYDSNKILSNSYNATRARCINAINSANNQVVSIVGSGDTGIYGVSSVILELVEQINPNIDIEIISGITSAISGSSLLGSPLTKDFAVISLSDNLSEQELTIDRIISVAKTNFSIVFYSPKNFTYNNLILAKELLLKYRKPETIVGIVKNIGSDQEKTIITQLGNLDINVVDPFTTIFIGREDTKIVKVKVKKMVTPLY